MPFYEYKVVPAPEKSPRVKRLKGTPRFAHALEALMNELAQDGWEYQRAESLPDEERKGLIGAREMVTRNVLVFRRELYFEDTAEPDTPLTLTQKTAGAEPDPAEADMESIYGPADHPPPAPDPVPAPEPLPEDDAPARRPLFAERRDRGPEG